MYNTHPKSLTKIANLLTDNFYRIAKFVKKRYKDSRFRRDRVEAEEQEMFNYSGVPAIFLLFPVLTKLNFFNLMALAASSAAQTIPSSN